MASIPDHSPLEGGVIVCSGCGKDMERKVVMNKRGVDHLYYSCKNAEKGCSYGFEKKVFVNAELKGIREDGSIVKVPEARV